MRGVVMITNKSMLTVDRIDVEGNAHNGPLVRLSFASLYDTLGMWGSHAFYIEVLTTEIVLHDILHSFIKF